MNSTQPTTELHGRTLRRANEIGNACLDLRLGVASGNRWGGADALRSGTGSERISIWIARGAAVYCVVAFRARGVAVVIVLPFIREPQAQPASEVLRILTSNIYSNLFSIVGWPLRAVGWRRLRKN
jgi:hypothetical protein